MRFLPGVIAVVALAACEKEASLPVEISPGQFTFAGQGAYQARRDNRGLFQIEHPLAASRAGDFGEIQTVVHIPRKAKPPYFLSFYVSDNNRNDIPGKPTGLMVDTRVGHRFQRCLIDGREVWSRDTCLPDSAVPEMIDITPFVKGRKFELRLGLIDRVDSSERLPGDRLELGAGAFTPEFSRYETRSYWGDVTLHCGARPKLSVRDWPDKLNLTRPDFPPQKASAGETLPVEKADLLKSRWAWPVVQGIPLPESACSRPPRFRLSHNGAEIPVGATELSRWRDGSAKWMLARFTLPPGTDGEMTLQFSSGESEPGHPVKGAGNGLVELQFENPSSFRILDSKGREAIGGLRLGARVSGRSYAATWEKAKVLSEDAWHAGVLLEGALRDAAGKTFGSCRVEATVFADVPYVRLLTTIRNETAGVSPLQDLILRLQSALNPAESPQGTAILTGPETGVLAAIRYFSNLAPIGIASGANGIECRFVDAATPSVEFYAGEELTYEIWLAVTDSPVSPQEAGAFAALVETPPRLQTSRLIRETRVWGEMPDADALKEPRLAAIIEKSLKPYFANPRTGARVFGNYAGFTQNFYWNSLHTLYALYAMTGEREWFDWAERSSRHLMDVLIRHWDASGRRLGGQYHYLREPGVEERFSVRLQNPHGLFDHWQMTGDPRGRELAGGLVRFLMTDEEMKMSARIESARHQGWALFALMRGWNETHDPAILSYAKELVVAAQSHTEPRRGAYVEIHGNLTFRGIVPFMLGNLMSGLREYYQATGDPAAGRLLFKTSWAVFDEMHNPRNTLAAPGIDYEYSPSPYHRESPRFKPLTFLSIAVAAGQAYAACISGDASLAAIAEGSWQGFLDGEQAPLTPQACYDLPAALYWLSKARELEK